MKSLWGVTLDPKESIVVRIPLTVTRPSAISLSAFRKDVNPDRDINLWSRTSFGVELVWDRDVKNLLHMLSFKAYVQFRTPCKMPLFLRIAHTAVFIDVLLNASEVNTSSRAVNSNRNAAWKFIRTEINPQLGIFKESETWNAPAGFRKWRQILQLLYIYLVN